MKQTTETFSAWLTRKREMLGLNQTELAARAGVSKNYISMLEGDKLTNAGRPIQPRTKQLDKLARALGVSMAEILVVAYQTPAKEDGAAVNDMVTLEPLFAIVQNKTKALAEMRLLLELQAEKERRGLI